MGMLVYINGAPGTGKLSIVRQMAKCLEARVLDNHAIYNVGFALTNFRSPAFYEALASEIREQSQAIATKRSHKISK